MEGTNAVPLAALAAANSHLTGQPLCPSCIGGYLHPYRVALSLPGKYEGGFCGAETLIGWVLVCKGNRDYNREYAKLPRDPDDDGPDPEPPVEVAPCGFSMPVTAYRWDLAERQLVPVDGRVPAP